ncbi:hypothetical protein L195_g043640, partial [Trifolium pratense]
GEFKAPSGSDFRFVAVAAGFGCPLDNLTQRGIITPESQSCIAGYGGIESAHHLFISCSTFGSLCSSVRSWIGFSLVDPQSLSDHFLQFTYSSGGS